MPARSTRSPRASWLWAWGKPRASWDFLTLDTKAYVAQILFGAETNTDDAEGEVTRTADTPAELFDPAFAVEALARTLGPQEQVPPAFSAISVDGVRSYKRAVRAKRLSFPRAPSRYSMPIFWVSRKKTAARSGRSPSR